MDINHLVELLRGLPFRQAVWLFPLATALHFLEEAPHFADWAGKYALTGYTHQRWRRIHGLGMVFAVAFCGLASMFQNRVVVFLILCPLLFRECPEWIVPCGRHGALWCLLPRPHHCSCLVSRAVLVPQSGCLSRGPVDQYTGRGGVLDRRGDSHCGRSHERVRCKAPITSPHDLMLRNLPRSHARRRSADPITPRQHAKIGSRRIGQHRYELQ